MTKIDRRISYKVVLDVESCPIDPKQMGVDPQNMLAYDVGYVITDKRGKIYRERSFVVYDIFVEESDKMTSAYYASKLPKYVEDLKNGKRQMISFYELRQILKADMDEYKVNEVYAHNARFDYHTLNRTQEYLTNGRFKWFFPYGTNVCDTLQMAKDVIGKMPTYKRFCIDNGFVTKKGQCRFTAEALYAFISNNPVFEESHTGLEDVMIEKEIMAYCYRQKKAMKKYLYGPKARAAKAA